SSECCRSAALAVRSAASSAILRVNASASVARSIAFLKRAVAINSMVRVILRMFWIARRRLTSCRVLAIPHSPSKDATALCRGPSVLCLLSRGGKKRSRPPRCVAREPNDPRGKPVGFPRPSSLRRLELPLEPRDRLPDTLLQRRRRDRRQPARRLPLRRRRRLGRRLAQLRLRERFGVRHLRLVPPYLADLLERVESFLVLAALELLDALVELLPRLRRLLPRRQRLAADHLVAQVRLLLAHVAQELLLPRRHVIQLHLVQV